MEQKQYIDRFVGSIIGDFDPRTIPDELYEQAFQNLSLLKCDLSENGANSNDIVGDVRRKIALPWIDVKIKQLCKKQAVCSPWPENKPFALCLSHDVDFASNQVTIGQINKRIKRVLYSAGPKSGGLYCLLSRIKHFIFRKEEEDYFEKWLKMEDSFGYKSTFFFLPTFIEKAHVYDMDYEFNDEVLFQGNKIKLRELILFIKNAGWDIGLHGSYLSAYDEKMLCAQKEELEAILRQPVYSVRQHHLNFDANSTLGYLENAEFKCDSTIGFNEMVGYKAGTSFPFYLWDFTNQRASKILEVPLGLMDSSLFSENRLHLSVDDALQICITLMDYVEKSGGCLVLNWHPNYVNIEKYNLVYQILLQEAKNRNAWGCTIQELSDYWINRV